MRGVYLGTMLFAFTGLVACAGIDIITLKPERRAQIKNVAVMTVLDNKVSQTRYTFFRHLPETHIEYVDWNFNEIVRKAALEGLAARQPHFAITPVTYDPAKLAKLMYVTPPTETKTEAEAVPYVDPERIKNELHAILGGTLIDTVILIASGGDAIDKCESGLIIGTSNMALVPTGVAVCLGVFVLDAKSLTVLSQLSGVINANYNRGGIFGPIDPAPFDASSKLPMNDAQRAFLRPTFERMLREATDQALKRSGL